MSLIGVFFPFRFFIQPVNAQYVVQRNSAFDTSDIIAADNRQRLQAAYAHSVKRDRVLFQRQEPQLHRRRLTARHHRIADRNGSGREVESKPRV